jgi:hypothetical protein
LHKASAGFTSDVSPRRAAIKKIAWRTIVFPIIKKETQLSTFSQPAPLVQHFRGRALLPKPQSFIGKKGQVCSPEFAS